MRVDFAGVKSVPIGAVLKQRGIEMRRAGRFPCRGELPAAVSRFEGDSDLQGQHLRKLVDVLFRIVPGCDRKEGR